MTLCTSQASSLRPIYQATMSMVHEPWRARWAVSPPPNLKVYTSINSDWGKAFPRIQKALHDFKPDWVTWVDTIKEADVHILHVLGALQPLRACRATFVHVLRIACTGAPSTIKTDPLPCDALP
jgi:hypothetical protein